MTRSAWFSLSSPLMWAAIGGTLGLGLMASLVGSRPRTAYTHAEAVRRAETALEAASLQADQAYLLVSELRADEHSDIKRLLAAKAHRVALERVEVCRQELVEATEARDLWMASLKVMREVIQDLRAAESAAEVVSIRAMERTLLAGFAPFRPVEKALRVLQSAFKVSLDLLAQEKADDALGEALDVAHTWLSDPVNVDPSVAPPSPESAVQAEPEAESEVQAEAETEPAVEEQGSAFLDAVRCAETALEAASLQADQAYLLASKLQADGHSGIKQLLAAKAHRVALEWVEDCRQDLVEAMEARDLWMASLEVMREVIRDLRAAETAFEAVSIRAMERTLLAEFAPFRPVEKALCALQSALEVSLDFPAQEGGALSKALNVAYAWLSNPVNADPPAAPPSPESAVQAEEETEPAAQAEAKAEPAFEEEDSEFLEEEE